MTLNRLQTFVESRAFRTVIILLILINSLSLGLDSYLDTKEERALLLTVDRVIVWIFVVELVCGWLYTALIFSAIHQVCLI